MNEPKCKYCGVDLSWLDNTDIDVGGNLYITVNGECPICGRNYRWVETYCYKDFSDLIEIPS